MWLRKALGYKNAGAQSVEHKIRGAKYRGAKCGALSVGPKVWGAKCGTHRTGRGL